MELISIDKLFNIKYGVNLELINLEQCKKSDSNSISFVSRIEKNNGISAFVQKIDGIESNPRYTISVAGGGSVLSSFYQKEPYYSGRDIYILIPKNKMTEVEMLFYTFCLTKNKYRYNYGRQANKTLKDILVPEKMPDEYRDIELEKINTLKSESIIDKNINLNTKKWKSFKISNLFNIKKGERLNKEERLEGKIPLVTASSNNGGISFFIESEEFKEKKKLFRDKITIDMFFNVFYHNYCYYSDDNVHTLLFKENFKKCDNKYVDLFITTSLKKIAYKYAYGRQVRIKRLENEIFKLPVKNNQPDWQFMKNYIKSLPYSKNI